MDTKPNNPTGAPVAVRNQNPLCLKGRGWKGQVGVDARGHAIFSTVTWGLRAAIVLLRTYRVRYGLRTIAGICARWAPSSDTVGSIPGVAPNTPVAYAKFVADRVGVSPTQDLEIFGGSEGLAIERLGRLERLITAMARYESGLEPAFTHDDFLDAATLSGATR